MVKGTATQDKLINLGIKIGGGIALFLFVKNLIKKAKNEEATNNLASDPNAQLAQQYRAAFNRSGVSWLMATDGTDNNAVWEAAKKTTNWKAVVTAYKNLYNANLGEDLTSELNPEELKKFYALISNTSLGFKFEVGDILKSKPLPGTTKIPYYYIYNLNGVQKLKLYAWHQVPGGIVGVVKTKLRKRIVDLDGVLKDVNAYTVIKAPFKSQPAFELIVLEREVQKR